MNEPQSADLKVTLNGIVIQAGATEILLSEQAARELLQALPALLKAFLEQVFRPGFAIEPDPSEMWAKLLTGRSARVVVTMGMPAWIYRWYFFAHSLKSLERNILGFVGIGPIKETLIGGIGAMDQKGRTRWLENMRALGRECK